MLTNLLQSLGLSEKEALMYLTLLRCGLQPTSILAKKAQMNRGTAHVVLHALLSKGLAMKSAKGGVQAFAPLDPKMLPSFIDHQVEEWTQKKEQVTSAIGQFIAVTNPHISLPKFEYFDGTEGARHVLEHSLTSEDPLLRAYLSLADISDFIGQEAFHEYTQARIRKGFSLHAIRTFEKDRSAFASNRYAKEYVTNPDQRRMVRHVSDDCAFPMTMYIYDRTIAIISSKEENFAVLIESGELAEMQRKLFDLLWLTLKK